jgi:hypothetical protein
MELTAKYWNIFGLLKQHVRQEELRSLLNVIVTLLGRLVLSLMLVMIKAELQNRNLCILSSFNIRLCYFEGGNGSCKQEISQYFAREMVQNISRVLGAMPLCRYLMQAV